MLKFKRSRLILYTTTLLLLLILFFHLTANGIIENSPEIFFPYDSLLYIEKSHSIASFVSDYPEEFLLSINWSFLPFLWNKIEILGVNPYVFFFMLNLSFILSSFKILSNRLTNQRSKLWFGGLFILVQPYFYTEILVPNKEIPILFIVALVSTLFEKRFGLRWLFVLPLLFLIKVQIILALLLLYFVNFLNLRIIGLFLVVGLSLFIVKSFTNALDMAVFLNNQVDVGNSVGSAELMLYLDKIASNPLLVVFILPIRFLLNLFAGFVSLPYLNLKFVGEFIPPATTFILSLISLLTLINSKIQFNVVMIRFKKLGFFRYSICFALVNTLIPYLQPRYFWFLIPFMLVYCLNNNSGLTKLKGWKQ